jgi:hypothetical protein
LSAAADFFEAEDRSGPARYFIGMMNLGHSITTLFFLTLAFGCDADDGLIDLDDPAAFDGERDSPEADDDERDESHADRGGMDLASVPAGGRHCVVEATVVPDGVDPATVQAADSKMTCFSTFANAIFSVTGERLSADATPETYEPAAITSTATQAAKYVSGVEYQLSSWGGASLTIYGSATCLTANSLVLNKFSDPWWDNRVSSAKAYSGCQHSYHYENMYLGGAVKDCGASCWYIGDPLQNRTSSIRWTK